LSETFVVLRIQQDVTINAYRYICKHHYFCQILIKIEVCQEILENPWTYNFMNIRPVEAELFHADGQMDIHYEANICFSQCCEKRLKLLEFRRSRFL
jgi:hypothetical protein